MALSVQAPPAPPGKDPFNERHTEAANGEGCRVGQRNLSRNVWRHRLGVVAEVGEDTRSHYMPASRDHAQDLFCGDLQLHAKPACSISPE